MSESTQPTIDPIEQSQFVPMPVEQPCRRSAPIDGPIGLIFALKMEASLFLSRLDDATVISGHDLQMTEGKIAGRKIVVAISGPGEKAARRAATAMIDGHSPRLVVSAGLAGSLVRTLPLGRIVLPDMLIDSAGHRLAVDSFPAATDEESDETQTSDDHPRMPLVTVDRVVSGPAPKADLREASGGLAVDMETFYTAEICLRGQVPFAAVRVIGDPLDRELPEDVERLLRSRNPMRQIGAALRTVWRNPSRAKDLYMLKRETDKAVKCLDEYLASIFETPAEQETEEGEPQADEVFGRIGPPREVD